MNPIYYTSITDSHIDSGKMHLLIECCIQAYSAFSSDHPDQCQLDKVVTPKGYELVDSWSGVDAVFAKNKTIECYGLVFRSLKTPYTYIFSFRGTDSFEDILDDTGIAKTQFKAFNPQAEIPQKVAVEAGFFDVYTTAKANTLSMQQQVFDLIDQYQSSDKPIGELYITGHSLGAALSQLFSLDVALSRPKIQASNVNFACPRVGNSSFVEFYMSQSTEQNPKTQTIRCQNTYDKVPCVPLVSMGYQHTPIAYLIAFYRHGALEKYNIIDRHASLNYQAVINGAAHQAYGVCVEAELYVEQSGYAVTTLKPKVDEVCSA